MKAHQPSIGRLTPAAIIAAAIELIRSEGFDALSMRKLGPRCGVGVMTLYGYFRTKEELLTAIAEQFMAEVESPDAGLAWPDQIKEIFRSVRRVFLDHPELADIVARQHLNATSAFRGAELAFAAMYRAGLSSEDAMSAFTALIAFTAGFAQRQRHLTRNPAIHEQRLAKLQELPPGEFQHVSQVAAVFVTGLTDRHFEDGLDLLVRGIASKAGK